MGTRFAYFISYVLVFMLFCSVTFAQKADSTRDLGVKVTKMNGDTSVPLIKTGPAHSPKKAFIYSLVCPGLGQAYNHKYWKIPIIYAGLGTFAYFIIFNQQQYNMFRSAITSAEIPTNNGIDPKYPAYSLDDLISSRDYYHRDRDLSVIGAAVFYTLNLVDAVVDAQLFSFNVDNDISVHFTPQINTFATSYGVTLAPTLSFVLRLK